jgi:hypothetical protein
MTLEVEVLDMPTSNNFCIWTWNDWNIYSMLYRELEYDESFFYKHKYEKIDIIWFVEFFLWILK